MHAGYDERAAVTATDERGFTLVELMVVVVVIAVVLGIAVPTFLDARNRSRQAADRATLDLATKAVTALIPPAGGSLTLDDVRSEQPGLGWQSGASTGPNQVDFVSGVLSGWGLPAVSRTAVAMRASDGTCLGIVLLGTPVPRYGRWSGTCDTAMATAVATAPSWDTVGQATGTVVTSADGGEFEYVYAPATWDRARTAAATRTRNGKRGFLATPGSAAEVAAMTSLGHLTVWVGGTDAAVEGTWRWASGGPDDGTAFWQGPGSGSGGLAVPPGGFSNWPNAGEPNGGFSENCLMVYANSPWNDLSCTMPLPGYVVEYR